jgi:AraC family transcriptional regulator, transcriptional activator of pobA
MEKLFRIIEIDDVLAREISSGPKEDHFHDFEELIIVSKGSLTHYIDFKVEEVSGPFACYVSMGKMHRLEPSPELRGWVINYKTEFIPDSTLSFYSNFFAFTNISLQSVSCLDNILNLCKILKCEYKRENPDYTVIRHLVNALIAIIDAENKRNIPSENDVKTKQLVVFNNFLKIVEENFRTDAGVSFYAGKMNMSERNLNLICRNNFQKSVSEIIETRKLIEAKRLLMYTDKTVSEIGFELGYNEKSYFTRVFHARMDITPSRYRELVNKISS